MKGSQLVLVVKNLPASAGDIRDTGLKPGSGRYAGGGFLAPTESNSVCEAAQPK